MTETRFEYSRRYAIEALGELKSEAALKTLHSLFTSNLDQEKVAIAEALGNIGDVSSIPLLNDLDENSSIFLKSNVLNAYSAIGSKNPQSIIENLKHPSVQVRRRTISVLGQIRATESIPSLIELLDDDEAAIRLDAVLALSNFPSDHYDLFSLYSI